MNEGTIIVDIAPYAEFGEGPEVIFCKESADDGCPSGILVEV